MNAIEVWFIWHGTLVGGRESKMTRKVVDYNSRDSPYILVGQQGDEYSLTIANTLRSLRAEIKSCKVDNDRLVEAQERLARAHEKHVEVNTVIL